MYVRPFSKRVQSGAPWNSSVPGCATLLSVVSQCLSAPWNVPGTFQGADKHWDTTDKSVAQPGTEEFQGAPLCTRFENGRTYMLPGCRGPRDKGYDPRVDGTTTNLF